MDRFWSEPMHPDSFFRSMVVSDPFEVVEDESPMYKDDLVLRPTARLVVTRKG